MNPLTNEQYHIGDVCEPAKFNESCSSCAAEVRCQFTKYTRAASWMHWFNLFGFYWGMFFVSALRFVPEFDSILFQAQVASSMPIWVDLAVTRMQTKKDVRSTIDYFATSSVNSGNSKFIYLL